MAITPSQPRINELNNSKRPNTSTSSRYGYINKLCLPIIFPKIFIKNIDTYHIF